MKTSSSPDFEVVARGYDFVEAPRISPTGDVWFSDLTGKGIYRKRLGHAPEEMLGGRQWVGGLVIDQSGQVICGGRGGIIALDPASGRTREILTVIEDCPIVAVNDMEGDGSGGFFAGTIDFVSIFEKGESPAAGIFFHVSAQGCVTVIRRDVLASNGIAASPCGKWLYHMETSRGIWRYPLNGGEPPTAGELHIQLDDGDGLAVDVAGNLWAACWETSRLVQFAPDGACLQELIFPYPHIVSLTFDPSRPSDCYVATGGNSSATAFGAIIRLTMEIPGIAGPLARLNSIQSPAASH